MMNQITMEQLKRLETTHGHPHKVHAQKCLKVYYGFSKINKIQKREAIAIVFENQEGAGWENSRSGKSLRKGMNIVVEREQTQDEASDAAQSNRVFTQWLIFLDDKKVGGSLEKALELNDEADRKNVSDKKRAEIKDKLRSWFKIHHPEYVEPNRQLDLQFKEW